MKNDYGVVLDRNGYAPSVLQGDLDRCYLCGGSAEKLDRHEVYPAANRQKSKALGLWVMLCHNSCHLYGVHQYAGLSYKLKEKAQRVAMEHYGWTTEDFIKHFGRNYL